jgi:ubiquinol-cytochrome c reductase cytochrome b subunit
MPAIRNWVEDRFPLKTLISLGQDEDIVGGASFFYTLGSATLFVFVLQVVTGIWQCFYYTPSIDHAYDSLMWMRAEVPFGWFVHGFHYWGANLMVVLVGIHMLRVFVWGAYKNPRQLVWLSGLALLLLTALTDFTGVPLRWDEAGYWVADVGSSIASTVPVVGALAGNALRGGATMGALTLSRFFVLHAAILPAAIMLTVFAHLAAFRMFGSVGPWRAEQRRSTRPFWPDQIFKDAVVATFLFLLLVFLSAYVPPPITGPADPTDTTYMPRPEWNFLFLFEALRFLPGKLEALGTVGIPGVIVIALAGLPFYDRNPDRDPAKRPIALVGMALLVGSIGLLTIIAARQAANTATLAQGTNSAGLRGPSVVAGEKLFGSLGCIGCHAIGGVGGSVGPVLTNIGARRSRSWIIEQIRDPATHFPGGTMPPYASLSPRDMNALVDYLVSRRVEVARKRTGRSNDTRRRDAMTKTISLLDVLSLGSALATEREEAGPSTAAMRAARALPPPKQQLEPPGRAATTIGSAGHGAVLFAQYCASCHGADARGGMPNPGSPLGRVPSLNPVPGQLASSEPEVFALNIDRVLQNGVEGSGALSMPAFGDTSTLSQADLADVIAYVMRLNGVDRAEIMHPGVTPKVYFHWCLGTTVTTAFLLAAGWLAMRLPVK